jgi:uncharacterized protein
MRGPVKAREASFRFHETQEHSIRARAIAQTFNIKVLQPTSRADGSERFAVLYVTDSDYFFGGLANLGTMMQGYGEVSRFILVGIGYENARAAGVLRMRDLLPHPVQKELDAVIRQTAVSEFVSGIDDVGNILGTTDAGDFLRFLREELMPFIDSRYPTLPNDNSYYGYSAGGTFGLYTLFTQPDTFRRYVVGSPATAYGGHNFSIDLVRSHLASGRSLDAKMFLSVGELEDSHRGVGEFEVVTGYCQVVRLLRQSVIAGLELTTRIFPDETHATAWSPAFSHGLKALLGPVEHVPYWPELSGGGQ